LAFTTGDESNIICTIVGDGNRKERQVSAEFQPLQGFKQFHIVERVETQFFSSPEVAMNRNIPASAGDTCTSSMITMVMGQNDGINLSRFKSNPVQSLV
jgi:hypothetical protein